MKEENRNYSFGCVKNLPRPIVLFISQLTCSQYKQGHTNTMCYCYSSLSLSVLFL